MSTSQTFCFVFNHDGQDYTVACFDNTTSRYTTAHVLQGNAYPLFSFVSNVEVILDVGANIGAASVRFAVAFPKAHVYSFEPAPASFELLQKNAAPHANITPSNIGFYSETKVGNLYRSHFDTVTASLGKSILNGDSFDTVQLVNPAQWMRLNSIPHIDILKIDTEGCEVQILTSLKEFIPRIKVVYVEYHSERDRRTIDELLAPTHILCSAHSQCGHLGELAYARQDLEPSNGELHIREITPPKL
jgi:FkbM family methyltransferase